jgi:type II secretory pathway component PulM
MNALATSSLLLPSLANITGSVRTVLEDVAARLRRTTPRERLLLAALASGSLLYALILALDFQAQEQELFANALADRAQAQSARSRASRVAAGAPDQLAIEDMRSWGVSAANVPIAQVRIEGRLLAAATAAELPNPRITTEDELVEIGPTNWLHADVETDLNWTATFAFLEEVGRLPTGFRVVRFEFEVEPNRGVANPEEFRPPRGRIRMTLGFPVEVANAGASS